MWVRPDVPREIFTTMIPGTGQHHAAGSVWGAPNPGDTDMTGLSKVTKTHADAAPHNHAPGMMSGTTRHERRASLAANPAAGVPGRWAPASGSS